MRSVDRGRMAVGAVRERGREETAMFRLGVVGALIAHLFASVPAQGAPSIEITTVPPYCSEGDLYGTVTGVQNPQDYQVATYIHIEGSGWWTKPYFNAPTVPVDSNGSFQVDVTTGGLDCRATLFCTNLVEAGQTPPLASGACCQPEAVSFLATATDERYGRTIPFSGPTSTWGVKESPLPVGPGPNRFSYETSDAWVDPDGKLHLKIDERDSNWYSTEVILTESLGYGQYLFQTSSRVDQLDTNAIFGAFLWDAFGEPALPLGRCNREVDFEDGVWSVPRPPENSQFVVQPWDTPGNLHRFQLPDLSQDAKLTRILTWEEGRLHFLLLRGHHSFDDYTPSDIIEEWLYLHDPAAQHFVPDPERERFRFNLWLRNGTPPAGDGDLEVVIDHFEYIAEPSVLVLLVAGLLPLVAPRRAASGSLARSIRRRP